MLSSLVNKDSPIQSIPYWKNMIIDIAATHKYLKIHYLRDMFSPI